MFRVDVIVVPLMEQRDLNTSQVSLSVLKEPVLVNGKSDKLDIDFTFFC